MHAIALTYFLPKPKDINYRLIANKITLMLILEKTPFLLVLLLDLNLILIYKNISLVLHPVFIVLQMVIINISFEKRLFYLRSIS